jgi:hypothetical protein
MTYDEYRKTTCEWCGKGNEAFGDSPMHWINTTGQPTYGYVACAALSPEAWGALESARAELQNFRSLQAHGQSCSGKRSRAGGAQRPIAR